MCFLLIQIKVEVLENVIVLCWLSFTFSLAISFIFWDERWEVSISEVFTVLPDKDSVWCTMEMSSGGLRSGSGLFSLESLLLSFFLCFSVVLLSSKAVCSVFLGKCLPSSTFREFSSLEISVSSDSSFEDRKM